MTPDVHVVAAGARTSVGLGADSSAAAVRAKISGIAEDRLLMDAAGRPLRCARDPSLPPTLMGSGRIVALSKSVLAEVLTQISVLPAIPPALHLFLALPDTRPGFGESEARLVVEQLESAGGSNLPRLKIDQVTGGHVGTLRALQKAVEHIEQNPNVPCLAGGVDTYFDLDALRWLEGKRCLAREGVRGGFVPGEAAGMLALMGGVQRSRQKLPSLARVHRTAIGPEPRSPDSDEGLLGEGLGEVIRNATHDLELIDDVYCDINGERHRSEEWGFVALRLPGLFRDTGGYVTAVASCGDVGAASGALSCVLAVQAWERGYACGARALVWSSSTHGLRGAAVLIRQMR